VTEQLIAPVIPPAPGLAHGRPGRAGAGRPLPLAGPLAVPLDAVYGMSRIDASGRLTSQVIRHVLNWQPGDRLTLTVGSGVVVARRDPGGVGGGERRDPPGVRLVLEPDRRALG
jgi:hypothetical protein